MSLRSAISSLLLALAVVYCLAVLSFPPAAAKTNGASYAGLEFYGSSQLSRLELEKYLSLKPGAALEQIGRAVDRLNRKLEERHLAAQVEIVEGSPGRIFVVVDVSDNTNLAPTRHLKHPRHVAVTTEKPFLLLDQLNDRLQKLTDTNRPWSEQVRSGLKYYTDEPANQIAEELIALVPDMRAELLAITESEPDNNRRRRAVELLSWAGSVPDTSRRLMPALDDADSSVRAAVARYLFPRLELLPPDFPYDDLVEAFSRMLSRPSHQDRTKALYCLLALVSQRPNLILNAKVFDEEKVKQLDDNSHIASIKSACDQLLNRFAHPPTPEQPGKASAFDASGF